MFKSFGNKGLSVLLAVLMLFSLVPAFNLTASAESTDCYLQASPYRCWLSADSLSDEGLTEQQATWDANPKDNKIADKIKTANFVYSTYAYGDFWLNITAGGGVANQLIIELDLPDDTTKFELLPGWGVYKNCTITASKDGGTTWYMVGRVLDEVSGMGTVFSSSQLSAEEIANTYAFLLADNTEKKILLRYHVDNEPGAYGKIQICNIGYNVYTNTTESYTTPTKAYTGDTSSTSFDDAISADYPPVLSEGISPADVDLILSPGDLNADGNFNAIDFILMKKVLFGTINDADIIDAADCTGDYEVNILDIIRLKTHVISIGAVEFIYKIENGTAIIVGYNGVIGGAVTVPCEIEGYPVTEIASSAFAGCTDITSLFIPSSVSKIGANALKDCSAVVSLALPDSIVSLGDGAFENCSDMSDLRLSQSTEKIGSRAFSGCSKLQKISFPITVSKVGDSAFNECVSLLSVEVPYETVFGSNVFDGCKELVVKGYYGSGGIDAAVNSGVNYELLDCGHLESIPLFAFNPTCTNAGYSGDEYCINCGKILVKGTVITATGHSYGAPQNVKAATCTEGGYTGDKTCIECGNIENGTTTSVLGHSYGVLQNVKSATCTEGGYTGDKTCGSCGNVVKGTTTSALGHSYGALQNVKAATCTENGYTGDKVCANCGDTVKGSTISKINHNWAINDASAVNCTNCETVCSHENLVFNFNMQLKCEVCEFLYCGFCNEFGHEEASCSNATRCTYCGGTGHTSTSCTYSTLKKGATGDLVKKLQTMLNTVNNAGLTVDGDFGSGTETAVKNFQSANGLDSDGIVGSKTWTALIEKYGSENGPKIAAGNYNPVSLVQGSAYSIDGKITSSNKITSVTVGVYNTDGTATSVIATATPNAKSYNISALDTSLKFGTLTEGTYYLVVIVTDTACTKVLVKNQFAVTTDLVKALKDRAFSNWVAPVKKKGFYDVTTGGRYFGASRDSGNRAHAGVDIHYSNGLGVPIYAMESGTVIEYIANFYGGMQAIAVQHADGSIARYCEISTDLRKGDIVAKGEQIATIAKSNIGGDTMLHLEIYLGTASGSLTNSSNTTYDYVPNKNYSRRRDIIDPTFVFDLIQ